MIPVILSTIISMYLLRSVVADTGEHEITIDPDPSPPGWADYDFSVENLKAERRDGSVVINFDVMNLGLCKATAGYGWYSPEGRSCWGEWDFEYKSSATVDIKIRVGDSSPPPGATYRIELDDIYLGDFEIPANDTWYIVTVHNVSVSPGQHTIFLGTYQMDYNPDIHLDYIMIGDLKIEAEEYDRMGGNDPNPDLRGLTVYPRDVKVQVWNGKPHEGYLIKELVIGKRQTVIDNEHLFEENTCTAHYIENNGTFHVKISWKPDASLLTGRIYVVVDPDDEIKEIKEENNIASVELRERVYIEDLFFLAMIILLGVAITILIISKMREKEL